MTNTRTCLLWFVPILSLGSNALGATYYISQTGDDARSAAQAQNRNTPWKSFANLSAQTLVAGDSILLRRGDTIRGTLEVPRGSGTQSRPIVISGFGSSLVQPVILGTESVTTWKASVTPGNWVGNITSPDTVRALFLQGKRLPIARFPQNGWITAQQVEGDTALVAAELGGQDWSTATLFVRPNRWTLETRTVTRQVGNRISFPKLAYKLPDSAQFFLTNHRAALTEGSWVYTAAFHVVTWKAPAGVTAVPAGMEASVFGDGIKLGGGSWIKVAGLTLVGSAKSAIIGTGLGANVENCNILDPGEYGISLSGADGRMYRNRITGAGAGGILAHGRSYEVLANTVNRVAQLPALTTLSIGKGIGIRVEGDSGNINGNMLDSIGYSGIFFVGANSRVEHNLVEHFCMTTDDGGGIYSWAGGYESAGSPGSLVKHNIVRNGIGAKGGWNTTRDDAEGIYFDDGSHDITVDSNLSTGNQIGLLYHNNRRMRGKGNILIGNRGPNFCLSHDNNAGAGDMFDNRMDSSVIYSNSNLGPDTLTMLNRAQTMPLGTMSGNLHCLDSKASIECKRNGTRAFMIDRLQGKEALAGPELLQNKGFDSSALGWVSWPATMTKVLESTPSNGKALKLNSGGIGNVNSPYIASQAEQSFQVGTWDWLQFRAKAKRPGQSISLLLLQSYDDYTKLSCPTRVVLDTAWAKYSILIEPIESDVRGRLYFINSLQDSVWWLDEASMRQIPPSLVPVNDGYLPLSNPTTSNQTTWLPSGPWMDDKGYEATSPQVLAPFQSKVLFRGQGKIVPKTVAPFQSPIAATRLGNNWVLAGLDSKAVIFDQRGRVLANIDPDHRGVGVWYPNSFSGMAYLRTNDKSSVIVMLR